MLPRRAQLAHAEHSAGPLLDGEVLQIEPSRLGSLPLRRADQLGAPDAEVVRNAGDDAQVRVGGPLQVLAPIRGLQRHRGRPVLDQTDLVPVRTRAAGLVVGTLECHAVPHRLAQNERAAHPLARTPVRSRDGHADHAAAGPFQHGRVHGQVRPRRDHHRAAGQGLHVAVPVAVLAVHVGGPEHLHALQRHDRRGQDVDRAAVDRIAAADFEGDALVHRGRGPGVLVAHGAVFRLADAAHLEGVFRQELAAIARDAQLARAAAANDLGGERHGPALDEHGTGLGRDVDDGRLARGGGLRAEGPIDRRPDGLAAEGGVEPEHGNDHRADDAGQPDMPGVDGPLEVRGGDLAGRSPLDGRQRARVHAPLPRQLERGGQVVAEVRVRPLDEPSDVEVVEPAGERIEDRHPEHRRLGEDECREQGAPDAAGQAVRREVVGHDDAQKHRQPHGDHHQARTEQPHQAQPPAGHPQGVLEEDLAVLLAEGLGHTSILSRVDRRAPVPATQFGRPRRGKVPPPRPLHPMHRPRPRLP